MSLSLLDLADMIELEPGDALGPKAYKAFMMFWLTPGAAFVYLLLNTDLAPLDL